MFFSPLLQLLLTLTVTVMEERSIEAHDEIPNDLLEHHSKYHESIKKINNFS